MSVSRVLAIDTSNSMTSVCLRAAGQSYEREALGIDSQNAKLAAFVEEVMHEAGLGYADLNLVVVGKGPGSFTGLRIGFSFVQGLALALGCPVLSVSSMRAAAWLLHNEVDYIAVEADARRDEVFGAIYCGTPGGGLGECLPVQILSRTLLREKLAELAQGSAALGKRVGLVSWLEALAPEDNHHYPKHLARGLVEVGQADFENEGLITHGVVGLAGLEPDYLRAVSAKSLAERGVKIPSV